VFGADGGKTMAAEYGMSYLGALAAEHADPGAGRQRPCPPWCPTRTARFAAIYKSGGRQVAISIAAKAKDFSSKFPSIKISKDT
jgi:ATP-binding protein involved in chromosome partitioning